MAKPIIAIVGRPNVGKSTLFNRLIGRRLSIVDDTPGVTRDRVYAPCEWTGRHVMLVDTGGIEPYSDSPLLEQMRAQAEIAIDSADAIIFVTDIRTGVTANDQDVARILQRSGKPVVLCVNKVDSVGQVPPEIFEYYNLGLGEPYPVSSVHGHGTGDLLDAVFEEIDFESIAQEEEDYTKVAIIGKPNVGKSSLVNKMLGDERMIVANEAGTTRDATDSKIENEHGKYILIDTAGIRRRSRVEEGVERYSVLRAFMAIDRADVCVMMIDATEGYTEQDSKIAGYAHEQGKAIIIVVNKWDLIEKDSSTMRQYRQQILTGLSFMTYAPMHFISAKTGQRVEQLYELVNYVENQNSIRISTGLLNDMLAAAVNRVQPPATSGRRLKIFYITQPSTRPPTFVCFVNDEKLFHFSYQRYIENFLRETFGLEGTPIRLIVRERGE